MSQVNANPDEIKAFAQHLLKISNELKELKSSTRRKMSKLNQSWRDKENSKFADQFESGIKPLDSLIKTAEEYAKYLRKKADILESYQR